MRFYVTATVAFCSWKNEKGILLFFILLGERNSDRGSSLYGRFHVASNSNIQVQH